MIVVVWSNGSPNYRTGSGYGIRIDQTDRDENFTRGWPSVSIEFEGGDEVDISISRSFWKDCIELRSSSVGKYLLEHGLAPWEKGHPPRLKLKPVGGRRFMLKP